MKTIIQNIFLSWDIIRWSIRQLIVPAPKESSILLLIIFIQGMLSGLSLFVIEQVVNWLSASSSIDASFPYKLLVLWAITLIIQYCLYPILTLVRLILNEKVLAHCNVEIMQKANSFQGLAPFENPAFFDNVQLLQKEAKNKPLNFAYIVMGFCTELISIISMSLVLATIGSIVPLLLIAAAIPYAMATLIMEGASWDQQVFKSPVARKMNWFSATVLEEKAAKEIRLFGFGNYFIHKYRQLSKDLLENVKTIRTSQCLKVVGLSLLTVIGNLGLFLWLINSRDRFSHNIGALVMVLQGFVLIQQELASLMQEIAMLYPVLSFFKKLKSFLSKTQSNDIPMKSHPKRVHTLADCIAFEHVSFSYENGKEVLKDVNLNIRAKEKVAIVGENGAGKTTLIKLLMRLYDPTSGRITIDGIDLRELDIACWRKNVSAVFQDFVQYHLTVAEYIGLGSPEDMQNLAKIEHASQKASFQKVLKKLKNGYQTPLGKEFGGTSLSGGEWQKLAMARALMKEASLLVLDEPTAALDPRSEHELFQKFAEHTAGKTTIFITHRLGSVLLADRIIVLKDGKVSEQGTHTELMQKEQDYATLFRMQAEQYAKL
jgi:ATP-binding cassette subfamily B protein